MPPKAPKLLKRPSAGLVDGKPPEQIKGRAGAAEAKAAATMTKEEWSKLQVGQKPKWPQPAYMIENREAQRSLTSYMDQTYEVVTRWMAKTRISYRPHAKAPGTKSHIRYEKYSKAKTVGEALELGSWPGDWCWDYERGFIKVLGPVRDEPLDPVTVEDEKELTEVDKAIYGWYVRELAKKYGFNVKDLYAEKNSGESAIILAHRLHAQRLAKAALSSAKSSGRRITDDEITQCLEAWGYARNPNRTNVFPDGRQWVWSDTLGLIRDRLGSIHVQKATTKYPEFTELIVKWLTDRLPKEVKHFKFTSLNLNKDYAAKLHRDGNNFGPSMIAAFGKFEGGELNYWSEDNKQSKLEKLPDKPTEKFQIGSGLALFNGNSAHSVSDFKGHRYSIVYFTASCHPSIHPEDATVLKDLGMPYPTPDEEEYALVREPRGYTSQGRPASAKSSTAMQPASYFWSRALLEKQAFTGRKLAPKALKDWEEQCTKLSKSVFALRRPKDGPEEKSENAKASGQKRPGADTLARATKKIRVAKAGA